MVEVCALVLGAREAYCGGELVRERCESESASEWREHEQQ